MAADRISSPSPAGGNPCLDRVTCKDWANREKARAGSGMLFSDVSSRLSTSSADQIISKNGEGAGFWKVPAGQTRPWGRPSFSVPRSQQKRGRGKVFETTQASGVGRIWESGKCGKVVWF